MNKHATFQPQEVHITLPLTPSLQLELITQAVIETIDLQSTTSQPEIVVTDNKHLDLLNFIDVDKLQPGRSSNTIKKYDLVDLKELTKLLNLNKQLKSKPDKVNHIDVIKKELDKTFHDDANLIGNIKKLNDTDIKNITSIEQVFKQHGISKSTTTTLIKKIKTVLKNYRTSDVIHKHIVDVIEHDWLPTKK